MIELFGFLIAVAVGLTGIGGGSFTVPVLLLFVGLPATAAVGTTFVFTGILRLIASPFYLLDKKIHWNYLKFLLEGAIPGLLIGTVLLRWMSGSSMAPLVVIILGVVLAASSAISFFKRLQNHRFAKRNTRWLPWLALPIGIESGFSSAGSGALGTVLLLNYSEMTAPEVVGTDLLFGLALSVIGAGLHWSVGGIREGVLIHLLAGGIPGVLVGCMFAKKVPVTKLKAAIALIALAAATQILWSGTENLLKVRTAAQAHVTAPVTAPATPNGAPAEIGGAAIGATVGTVGATVIPTVHAQDVSAKPEEADTR